jgi:hypothetical protein
MKRASGFVACIADGEAKRYAPGADTTRIVIVYRERFSPSQGETGFERAGYSISFPTRGIGSRNETVQTAGVDAENAPRATRSMR